MEFIISQLGYKNVTSYDFKYVIATIEIVWLVSFERLECGLLNVL